ncbi:hypothetical protein ACFORL_11640 [Legionella dresdenensis]|uniref:Uncharacterized protein n=1 Tax=Legionella dresdenensis TaxID=450200 RepID=A0ABV8CHM0_9GAMM
MTKYQTVYEDELDTFIKICHEEGYDPNEFNFNEHNVQNPSSIGSVYGKVTISRNGKSKTYNTGNGSSWNADFENDLKNKSFD